MKIDRHNYEEFFLLYVDDELTTEQKIAVEQFVQENPDLAVELEILLQSTLHADDSVVFDGKESLLKKESDSIVNLDNYEEYLIAYIDNELNDQEKIDFYKFTIAHPQVKEELSIYQQTKLQPEQKIVFTNKKILYRREEKVKIVSLQWWKIAVAAAIILTIGITAISILNKKATSVTPEVATKDSPSKNENTAPVNEDQQIKNAEETTPVIINNNAGNLAKTVIQEKKEKNILELKTGKEKEMKKTVLPAPAINTNEAIAKNTTAPANNTNVTGTNKPETKIIDAVRKPVEETKLNNKIAVNTNLSKENSSRETVTNNSEVAYNNTTSSLTEDFSTISYEEGRNKKSRGFFRKVTRVFERRTNISAADDENKQDKLRIGMLAVKLK